MNTSVETQHTNGTDGENKLTTLSQPMNFLSKGPFSQADWCFLMKRFNEAIVLYESSLEGDQPTSENGHAEFQLGVLHFEKKEFLLAEEYFRKSIPKLRSGSEKENGRDIVDLGVAYENGYGVEEDKAVALLYYQRAADRYGDARAQNFLGLMYDHAKGVVEDRELAVKYYHQAADQGHVRALCNLGVMYGTGLGVTENKEQALKFYKMAAELGYAQAQYNLGGMYFRGEGTAKNKSMALHYYQMAALQGHVSAMCNLGMMYFSHVAEYIPQNKELGLDYFRNAARLGNARSQYTLGTLYLKGHHVKVDYPMAYLYFRTAAKQLFPQAVTSMEQIFIGTRGPEVQRVAIDSVASEWPSSHSLLNQKCVGCIKELHVVFLCSQDVSIFDIPKELIPEITKWLIRVWPDHHYVKEKEGEKVIDKGVG